MMDYTEALAFLTSFTGYEQGTDSLKSPERFNLGRISYLCQVLGNPHAGFPSVHIAGTKGKGSTAAILASILHAAGYRVGLYTSPHLHTLRERITINGQMVGQEELAELISELAPTVQTMHRNRPELGAISTFELLTASAFVYFANRQVDLAVLETGLGGRLDATNVVRPLVSIITSISLDHTDILGETIALIAREKAGIIKDEGSVVTAPQPAEAIAVLEDICRQRRATLYLVGGDWKWQLEGHGLDGNHFSVQGLYHSYDNMFLPLLGKHQAVNAVTAIGGAELLIGRGFPVSPEQVRAGLSRVLWPGRLEVLSYRSLRRSPLWGRFFEPFGPLVVVDGAHNGDSMEKLRSALEENFRYHKLHLVFGASLSKDLDGMARAIAPAAHKIMLTRSQHPRSQEPADLRTVFEKYSNEVVIVNEVGQAIDYAVSAADPSDLVCVTGSLFVVAEAREHFGRAIVEP